MNLSSLTSLFRRPDPETIAERAAVLATEKYRVAQAAADEAARSALKEVQELARAQGLVGVPGQPVASSSGPRLYARDHPWDWVSYQGSSYRPRQMVTVEVLREFAGKYDVLRAMINHVKNEVEAVPFSIVAKDADDDSPATKARIAEVENWFEVEGGLGGFGLTRHDFEAMVIEDLHVIGPAAVYLQPTRGGGIFQAIPIDAATIKPRVDAYGWPGPGENWYEQYVDGILQRGFLPEEMYWRGLYPRTNSPYPDSPTEYLVLTVLAALSADTWNREWLTNGDEPGRWISLPPDMPIAEVRAYIELFHEKNAGNTRDRQKVHFFPGGTTQPQQSSRRDMDFEAFQLSLARRCGAIIGVLLSAIGLDDGKQYAVSQAGAMEQTSSVGIAKILKYLEILYNYILRRNGYQDLVARYMTEKEETAAEKAERVMKLTGVPMWTPNRGLQELGDDVSQEPGADVLWVPATSQPMDLALNPPEPPRLPGTAPEGAESGGDRQAQQQRAELKRWERKALRLLKQSGSAACAWESDMLGEEIVAGILERLAECSEPEAVKRLFAESLEEYFPPVYHTSAQGYERSLIGRRWAERRLAAEREA